MKLLDTIQNNLRLYQGMTQAKVSYDFLKTQKEEDLLRLSEQINQMDASKIILMLQESAVAYLIKDPKFLPDLIRLECEEKISINSINSMLAHAGEDPLRLHIEKCIWRYWWIISIRIGKSYYLFESCKICNKSKTKNREKM